MLTETTDVGLEAGMNLQAEIMRWASPEPNTGCWLWTGGATALGYPLMSWRIGATRKSFRAHRVSYEAFKGPIPPGLHLDHLCRMPYCVNPDHLEPVTPRENTLRGNGPAAVNSKKTVCKHGHSLLDAENVRLWQGERICRACQREAQRRRRGCP